MNVLYSIAYQLSDGSKGHLLKTVGSTSVEVLTDGVFVFKDPSQVEQGDVIRVREGHAQRAVVTEVAFHDFKWHRKGSPHLVNIAARSGTPPSEFKLSFPADRELWCSVQGEPTVKRAGDLRVGDIVWSDLDQIYARVFYTNN
jgi:hypothetical protein